MSVHDTAPVALVTGGTRGIGAAISTRLAADGWHVLATYRSDHGAATALAAAHERIEVVAADVAVDGGCERSVAAALDRFGCLDHVVASAAISRDAPIGELTRADWDAVVATNLGGAYALVDAALPALRASGRGRMVFVSSIAATMGNATQAAYAASKAGLLGLARSLAREVQRDGITVNLVLPGPTADTGITAETDPAFVAAIERRIPLGRLGRPAEIAHAVRYLLDDLAGFTTGTSLVVDGGLSM